MLNYIFLLFYGMNGFLLHDFHLSICEIEFDKESKALEITHRIFLDDLEEALRKWSGDETVDVLNPKDKDQLQLMIGGYVLDHFSVRVNDKINVLSFVGAESEADVMYCYVEMTNVKKVKSLYVENKILMKEFDDQTNVVRFNKDGQTTSARLTSDELIFSKEFD